MFNKVLIAEDLEDINKGVYTMLSEIGVKEIHQVQYCDDAYLKIKKAILDKDPFELLITDLSFKEDYREQKFSSGEELIKMLKHDLPEFKIITYSIDDRLQKVRALMKKNINAYVCKGRKGLKELSEAVHNVFKNEFYLSPQVKYALNEKSDLEITEYDIEIVHLLSKGYTQEDISFQFKKLCISPASLSAVEKRLNRLRIQFKAKNVIHLIAIVKDLGLI